MARLAATIAANPIKSDIKSRILTHPIPDKESRRARLRLSRLYLLAFWGEFG